MRESPCEFESESIKINFNCQIMQNRSVKMRGFKINSNVKFFAKKLLEINFKLSY